MSLLDGGIRAIFASAFGGLYLTGTLHQGTGQPVYGTGGAITGYTGGGDASVKLQVDAATDAMRRDGGFAEGDVRIIVLAQGVSALTSDHEVTTRGIRYRIMSSELDAAASHWVCRARAV